MKAQRFEPFCGKDGIGGLPRLQTDAPMHYEIDLAAGIHLDHREHILGHVEIELRQPVNVLPVPAYFG